jgi:hypothetical protein
MSAFSEIIVAVVAAAGIPSAVFAALFSRWMKRQDARDKAKVRAEVLLFKGNRSAITLGEECAKAIQTGEHDGPLDRALAHATATKHEQQDFLVEEAAQRHG